MEETKRCPYCGEEILAVAKKCKHCGEWLETKKSEKEKKACPVCGEQIDVDVEVCPYCKEPNIFGDSKSSAEMSQEGENYHGHQKDSNIPITKNGINTGGSIWKNKLLRKIGEYVLYIALGGAIAGGLAGIKQCAREKHRKDSPELSNALADALTKGKEEAFRKLTKAPWTGVNSITETCTEYGWKIVKTITFDSKKSYATNNTYTESGIIKLNVMCSKANLKWCAEGSIKFQETGDMSIYSESNMDEYNQNFDGEIIVSRVTYNNTDADDEDIAMEVRLKLNEFLKTIQKSEESTHYMIKTLTEDSLVLEEGNILEPTDNKWTYKR